MIELIMKYATQGVFLIISLFLYVFVISCILPKLLLTVRGRAQDVRDRGIKKYVFEQGRAIVYEPALGERKYMPQYILSDHCGDRFLKCKLDKRIKTIKYRVVAYDANDGMLTALDVAQRITKLGMTAAVSLPDRTAYVCVAVQEINGVKQGNKPMLSFSLIRVGIFALASVLLTVVEAFIVKKALLFVADLAVMTKLIFSDEVVTSFTEKVPMNNGFTAVTAILVGLFYSVIVLLSYHSWDIHYEK